MPSVISSLKKKDLTRSKVLNQNPSNLLYTILCEQKCTILEDIYVQHIVEDETKKRNEYIFYKKPSFYKSISSFTNSALKTYVNMILLCRPFSCWSRFANLPQELLFVKGNGVGGTRSSFRCHLISLM